MNREIKFKAKGKISGDWVEGCLIVGVSSQSGKYYILPNVHNLAYVKNCHPLDGVEIDPNTICLLITKIVDVEIYEYDCWYHKKVNRIEYFSYELNGQLGVQSYSFKNDKLEHIHYTLNLDTVKSVRTSILKKELIFIGNWHDGEEYLLNKIKEVHQC
jgi:hypothetical protein